MNDSCFLNKTLKKDKILLKHSLNRILAQDIIAPINVPAHTNSAMDGFAINAKSKDNKFTIIGTTLAGSSFSGKVATGEAVAITTGAKIPINANLVIPQELTHQEDNQVTVYEYGSGSNIRQQGEDIKKGEVILKNGKLITPVDLGLLASLGIAEVEVWQKLKVAFFSTGDEICEVGNILKDGQIFDSNRYSILGMLAKMNIEFFDFGIIKDEPNAIKDVFLEASEVADVIISSGGVSVGEADYVKDIIKEVGNIEFWKLAIKPGRPLTFGTINATYFFGLPGNPVATIVTFYQIVAPVLKTLMGQKSNIEPLTIIAKTDNDIKKSFGRREFVRGVLTCKNNEMVVEKLSKQGSGVLSSVVNANCFIVLNEKLKSVNRGDLVEVQPFYGLV